MDSMTGEGDAGIVFRTIGERRSIREYEEREVPEEMIRRIIGAGVQAPTGLGVQPWRFIVVRDADLMREVSDYCKAAMIGNFEETTDENIQRFLSLLRQKEFNIFYNAPVLILVLGAVEDDMSPLDCTLCAENMLLAAWSLGIGSCWVGSAGIVQENPDLLERLEVPDGYDVVAPLIFGYPANVPAKPERPGAGDHLGRVDWLPSGIYDPERSFFPDGSSPKGEPDGRHMALVVPVVIGLGVLVAGCTTSGGDNATTPTASPTATETAPLWRQRLPPRPQRRPPGRLLP